MLSRNESLKVIHEIELFLASTNEFLPADLDEMILRSNYSFFWHAINCIFTARNLIVAGNESPAAVLLRVAIEHATYMEWMRTAPKAFERFEYCCRSRNLRINNERYEMGFSIDKVDPITVGLEKKSEQLDFSSILAELNERRPDIRGIWENLSFYVHPSLQTIDKYVIDEKDNKIVLNEIVQLPEKELSWYAAVISFRLLNEYLTIDVSYPNAKNFLQKIADDLKISFRN